MPLAKVIPIVNGLIYTILSDAPNPFVQVTHQLCVVLLHAVVCRLMFGRSCLNG